MLSNSESAKRVSELMLDIFRRVDESVAMVTKTCSPEEAATYSQAVGRIAGALVMDVLEPLYDTNPELIFFRRNELDQVNDDIHDVADRAIAKELGSGHLTIRTVGDYCDHIVRCFRVRPQDVKRLLDIDKSQRT